MRGKVALNGAGDRSPPTLKEVEGMSENEAIT